MGSAGLLHCGSASRNGRCPAVTGPGTHVSGAVIVTTPQEVAVGDALRGAKMFERVGVPVLGVVENMSGFTDPETGRRFDLFSSGGGGRLAEELGVPLLGTVPLQ